MGVYFFRGPFLGPFFLGYFTQLFNSQRYGIAVVLFLLVIGAILLHFVDEEAGAGWGQWGLVEVKVSEYCRVDG